MRGRQSRTIVAAVPSSAASLLKCHGVAAGLCGAALGPGDGEQSRWSGPEQERHGSASPYSISAPWGLYCRLSPPSRSPEVGGGLLQSTLAVMSAGAGLTEGLCAGLQAVQRAQPGSRCGSVGLEEAPVTHSSPGTESFA